MLKMVSKAALAFVCVLVAGQVNAEEPVGTSGISQSSLSAMGLSGLQTADTSARDVRGQGFFSFASSSAFRFPSAPPPLSTVQNNVQGPVPQILGGGPINGTLSTNDFSASISVSTAFNRSFLFGFIPTGNVGPTVVGYGAGLSY